MEGGVGGHGHLGQWHFLRSRRQFETVIFTSSIPAPVLSGAMGTRRQLRHTSRPERSRAPRYTESNGARATKARSSCLSRSPPF